MYAKVREVVNTAKFGEIYQEMNQPPYQKLTRFLERTAENIASFQNAPDRKEEILSTLQKLAVEKYPQRKE